MQKEKEIVCKTENRYKRILGPEEKKERKN